METLRQQGTTKDEVGPWVGSERAPSGERASAASGHPAANGEWAENVWCAARFVFWRPDMAKRIRLSWQEALTNVVAWAKTADKQRLQRAMRERGSGHVRGLLASAVYAPKQAASNSKAGDGDSCRTVDEDGQRVLSCLALISMDNQIAHTPASIAQ
ncbi:hypothetical protein B484DRAFT_405200 [Ochromonadaceae sp. CCMP2298]|nr:hypothetical protein B484DRAFT_405200 [Ochromonadaceae sp. CCMP2298]